MEKALVNPLGPSADETKSEERGLNVKIPERLRNDQRGLSEDIQKPPLPPGENAATGLRGPTSKNH